ncbi:MAG TPA: alpha/beta hydrolase [Blastocatellia bacterium]|nr:alpha/beta hydrolase [Blastocatellia bacterium]
MPHVQTNRLRIYYEIHGSGEPLVLIRGLGSACDSAPQLVEKLADSLRVLSFDNRCVGLTDQPQQSFTVADMADDTAALMDALKVESAHVLGISLGGMIAQELALRHPQKVRRLALACTHAGVRTCVRSPAWASQIFNEASEMPRPEARRHSVPILFSRKTIRERPDIIEEMLQTAMNNNQSKASYLLQLGAALTHDTYDRLHEVKRRTLVLTGAEDVLIDPGNSRLIAERIPGARLVEFEETGHVFFLERVDEVSRALIDFFQGE